MKKTVLLITALFTFTNIFAQDCNLNEEAKRHIGRAQGFKAVAEKDEDYQNVFNEFKEAFKYAPNCPDICYNVAYSAEILGKINYNYCDTAVEYYGKYLQINPNASDKNEIETKIYEIQAKKEIYAQKQMENEKKQMDKWVGTWDVIRIYGKYSMLPDPWDYIEIYVQYGCLYAYVPTIVKRRNDGKIERRSDPLKINTNGGYIELNYDITVDLRQIKREMIVKLVDENHALGKDKIDGQEYKLERRK